MTTLRVEFDAITGDLVKGFRQSGREGEKLEKILGKTAKESLNVREAALKLERAQAAAGRAQGDEYRRGDRSQLDATAASRREKAQAKLNAELREATGANARAAAAQAAPAAGRGGDDRCSCACDRRDEEHGLVAVDADQARDGRWRCAGRDRCCCGREERGQLRAADGQSPGEAAHHETRDDGLEQARARPRRENAVLCWRGCGGDGRAGRAGLQREQNLQESSPGTLDLAAASGTDLGNAARIQTETLHQFWLSADRAGKVADVLAQISNRSAADIDSMQESLKYVGPVAFSAGQSLESMGAAIGLMANAGIKGSAGRHLAAHRDGSLAGAHGAGH